MYSDSPHLTEVKIESQSSKMLFPSLQRHCRVERAWLQGRRTALKLASPLTNQSGWTNQGCRVYSCKMSTTTLTP
jgi:hypothetical protein